MLWKKESNQQNALYVDVGKIPEVVKMMSLRNTINANYLRFQRCNEQKVFEKKNELSIRLRKKGNEFFGRNEFPKALEKYSESLCFAVERSEHISLAYANRSHCFLKMKMYQECLNDIELAKAAAYRQHLMQKLNDREAECIKHMKEEEGVTFITKCDLKLSFEPNDQFPCVANVLQIDTDTNGDYSVTAKEDIDVGQTIAIEKAFSAYLYMRFYSRCNICLKEMCNLVPCKKCNVAMFCLDCEDNCLHELECGKRIANDTKENGDVMEDVRTILMAISAFTNIDELMHFVERTIKNEPISETLTDMQSKYQEYLKLQMYKNHNEIFQIIFHAINIYKYILHIPKIAAMFKAEKHHRFIKHLIVHHSLSTTFNSRRTMQYDLKMNRGMVVQAPCFTQTGIMHKYFKHSCAPNVFLGEIDGHFVCVTIRPIKKGEQLFTSFYRFLLKPKRERQEIFFHRTQQFCKCIRCECLSAPFKRNLQLSLDPDFQYIKSTFPSLDYCEFSVYPYHSDRKKSCAIAQKCVQFLKNHGQSPWCNEIGLVVGVYMYLLRLWISPTDIMPLL